MLPQFERRKSLKLDLRYTCLKPYCWQSLKNKLVEQSRSCWINQFGDARCFFSSTLAEIIHVIANTSSKQHAAAQTARQRPDRNWNKQTTRTNLKNLLGSMDQVPTLWPPEMNGCSGGSINLVSLDYAQTQICLSNKWRRSKRTGWQWSLGHMAVNTPNVARKKIAKSKWNCQGPCPN